MARRDWDRRGCQLREHGAARAIMMAESATVPPGLPGGGCARRRDLLVRPPRAEPPVMWKSRFRLLLTAIVAASTLGACGGPQGRWSVERVVRSDSRVVRRHVAFAATGRRPPAERGDQAIARRLRAAGARRHRRPAGGRGDAGPGQRHQPDCRAGQTTAIELGAAPAQQQRSLLLDHRVPGARRKPQEHP